MFSTDYADILAQVQLVDPIKYGRTRNFKDGAVTRLSPYISRGVISTKQVFQATMKRGFNPERIEKFLQELAWRDYWQLIWRNEGARIDKDLRQSQLDVDHLNCPQALLQAKTGVNAIDNAISEFLHTGYMHNHMRMYVASVACNVGKSHWLNPAQWMYYYLLDGDWASNALSWQWVVGSNSKKKYLANQENINKYFYSKQKETFLDVTYQELASIKCPATLNAQEHFAGETTLPKPDPVSIDGKLPTYIYNYYNLDPDWDRNVKANRILLLEPSIFRRYPISDQCVDFALELSKNIEGIQVFVGEFKELIKTHNIEQIYFKEHPLNTHYQGTEVPRDWMFSVTGKYSSFFAFWKKCKKELKQLELEF